MYIWGAQLRNSDTARGHGWGGLTVPSAEPSSLCQELANAERAGQWPIPTQGWGLTKPTVLNSHKAKPRVSNVSHPRAHKCTGIYIKDCARAGHDRSALQEPGVLAAAMSPFAASSFKKHVQGHPRLQEVFPELTCKTTYLSNLWWPYKGLVTSSHEILSHPPCLMTNLREEGRTRKMKKNLISFVLLA